MRRANSDALTSVFNRGAGDALVKKMLEQGQKGAFIIADIDDFKHINDTYGHQTGDEVIRVVSAQLKTVFRDNDVVWRLGDDEFSVFAINLLSEEICRERFLQAQQDISAITVSGSTLSVKLSIGCALCRSPDCRLDAIYKAGDDALYAAKQRGKDRCVFCELKPRARPAAIKPGYFPSRIRLSKKLRLAMSRSFLISSLIGADSIPDLGKADL